MTFNIYRGNRIGLQNLVIGWHIGSMSRYKFWLKSFWIFPSCSFVPNNFPQTSQALSFWWMVFVCLFKMCWVLNVFPQRSQINGRSVWWHIICVLRDEADINFLSHWSHANCLCSGNLWVFKWQLSFEIETKVFPHSPHSNGLSPVCVLLNDYEIVFHKGPSSRVSKNKKNCLLTFPILWSL